MAFISSVGDVQRQIGIRLNEVSATEADVYLTDINSTTHDVESQLLERAPRYLETSADHTVSASTYIYTFPMTDFSSMYSVIDPVNTRKLSYVTKQEFDALSPSASSQIDVPTHYAIWLENIYFFPTPNSNYTYHYSYQKALQDVSAASASLPFPNRFLELYVLRGQALGYERRGDFDQAAIFHQRYQTKVEQMIKALKDVGMKRIKSGREFRPNFTSDPIKNTIWNA